MDAIENRQENQTELLHKLHQFKAEMGEKFKNQLSPVKPPQQKQQPKPEDSLRTLTDTQIHQGFLKCENEISAKNFEINNRINDLREEMNDLKEPLENLIQDLFKEKEVIQRELDRRQHYPDQEEIMVSFLFTFIEQTSHQL
jgi:hypothetical protein